MNQVSLAPVIGTIDPTGGPEDRQPLQMAKMPFYPRDFRSSTVGWPLIAKGTYRELLDVQWDMGSLPADPRELRAIAAASPSEWKTAWPYLDPKFPIGNDGRRRNARLESHRVKAVNSAKSQSAGGIKGNKKRWGGS